MPLPATWNTVTITATFTRADTAGPAAGAVQFTPVKAVGIAADVVLPALITATLNGSGQISVSLPCPNSAGVTSLVYEVIERVPGGRSYYIEIDSSMTSLGLESLPKVDTAPAPDWYATLEGIAGAAAGSASDAAASAAVAQAYGPDVLDRVEVLEISQGDGVPGVASYTDIATKFPAPNAGQQVDVLIDADPAKVGRWAYLGGVWVKAADRVSGLDSFKSDLDGYALQLQSGKNLYNPAAKRTNTFLNGTSGAIGAATDWTVSGFIPVTAGQQYTISANANKRVGAAFYSTNEAAGSGYVAGSYNGGTVNASTPLTLTAPVGAFYMVMNVKSNTIAEPSQIQVEAGASATAFEAYFTPRRVVKDVGAPGLNARVQELELASNDVAPMLRLGSGETSSIEVIRNGDTIRREFTAWPARALASAPVFNHTTDKVNGVSVKVMADDAAPYYALGETIGANHGYKLTDLTATAHGKAQADIGSVWDTGGTQYVLLGIKDANTLRMAARSSNANAPTGTYTNVSGATNTGNIAASSVSTSPMWFAAITNRECRCYVDGIEVTDHGATTAYRDRVAFHESYDVLDRQTAIDWFIANPGTTSVEASGAPAFSVTLVHEFDRDGNYTLYTDFIARRNGVALTSLMFTQAQRMSVTGDGSIQYYVPKALPFVHEGATRDWANIDTSDTTGWASRADFTPARCEPAGILADRLVMLSNNYGFAIGLLPVQDADPSVRRANATVKALQISNSSGKVYMACIDKGSVTLNIGDAFKAIAYRNVFKRPTGRTCSYIVRTRDAAYLYADWHAVTTDRVPIPPDLVGRSFTVVEKSSNVALLSTSLTTGLLVNVDGSASYGYLIIKVSGP